mmetsp:Transcript_91217/g.144084  ORF Transcript_91217/g.144084 Transcript_91217/m.144084 type:complete len:83 (-) Transcript_91217:896-1144(-)
MVAIYPSVSEDAPVAKKAFHGLNVSAYSLTQLVASRICITPTRKFSTETSKVRTFFWTEMVVQRLQILAWLASHTRRLIKLT